MHKVILSTLTLVLLTACGGGGGGSTTTPSTTNPFDSKAKLGEALFLDKNLSKTRNTSCATCHNPEHAFVDTRFSEAGADQAIFIHGALSVGDDGFSLGGTNSPTAAYAHLSPEFNISNGIPKGGQFHNGRAKTLADQATRPPLDIHEMQMPSNASVVERIQENPLYVEAFETLYGKTIFNDTNASYQAMADAMEAFQKTELFSPFDSKYDRFLKCRAQGGGTNECYEADNWTELEQLGESLFFSNANTNCKTCHQLKSDIDLMEETFSNYEYHNIGTPKNLKALQARVDVGSAQSADVIDHGVFGAYPEEVNASKDGSVRVPTLRNVALTAPYMHNGVFQELKTVLEFYDHMGGNGRRLINPETNEPWGEPDVNATINRTDLQMPELDDRKIEALEAFLKTLTDKRYEHLLN